MTAQRRALTIPFVNKDNLMENPLKIPLPSLASECGKLDGQVSWTAFAGCKLRYHDSKHKNGSMLSDHKHSATVSLEMTRRTPCLVLIDVLKTDLGRTYMERIKHRHQMSSMQRDSAQCKEEPVTCREKRSNRKEANDSKSTTPKHDQRYISSPSHRSRVRSRIQIVDYEDDQDESKDIKEVMIGKDNGEDYKFAEVVDCGLSVSWKSADDTGDHEEFSPVSIKNKWTDPDKEQHSLKRRRRDVGSQCNGTGGTKRHRESVLRLTGEDRRDGGPATAPVCEEESGEDGDMGRGIVQFTVGGDDGTPVLVSVINPNVEAGDLIGTSRRSLSSSKDNTTRTKGPSEPIVLSSDDESADVPESSSPAVHRTEDTGKQAQPSQEVVARQQEASDVQEVQVLHVDDEQPVSVAYYPTPTADYSCMDLAFSTLYCGGYLGKASGDIVMAAHEIIIPLQDTDGQVKVMLNIERKDLRRYSVWEQQEMEMRELQFEDYEDSLPVAALLLCVSESAAAAVQDGLCRLCVKHKTSTPGTASPFILLTLRDPLEGMEGALLRSLLDIDCLNSLTLEQSTVSQSVDRFSFWEDIHNPVLSLDDSVELIRRTGLDSHLLSMLGLEDTDSEPNTEKDGSHSDADKSSTTSDLLEAEPQEEAVSEMETAPEKDTKMQLKPEEEPKEQEAEHPPQERKEEPTPVYTLCHRRTKGSYSVSLCKPDSGWNRYKHQGLAQRLIQFPPPPLKGGITVTLEDLQCLDSGQFLNDVIIDFYLKYLFHNASSAVAERSHIFSSFFYKQLTRRDNASEGSASDSCQRQRRHQRVKTWTRHVDIFKKDFLFVPVNQEAHWYLVVICFPGLDVAKFEAWTGPDSGTAKSHGGTDESQDQVEAQGSKSPNNNTETQFTLNHSDNTDTDAEKAQEEATKDPPPGQVNCTEKTLQKKAVCKMPCILIMDSLKLSLHERVFKLLREYLQSEWEVRRGSSRDFGPEKMKSSHCHVPLQDNSSDCGLYLLQYVESFLKDPVVHFDLPLHLERWFPRQKVRRKRDEIRDLVLNLYRQQNRDKNR